MSLLRYLILTCMALAAADAFAANPVNIDLAIRGLHAQQPPRMVDDALILTFGAEHPTPDQRARYVGVRFAHESFTILHPYARNEYGVFVLDYPVPEGLREIRYRIVVDGLCMSDPTNPAVETDALGNDISVFILEKEPARPISNPREERDGEISFVFRGEPGKRVAIAGDFNNWDPFMDYLDETAPGMYRITLRVPRGGHWYYFFSSGRRILDMYNSRTGVDPDGNRLSYFVKE